MKSCIFFIEKNVRGAWVIYGLCGVRQYYDYTREEAMQAYKAEYEKTYKEGVSKK